MQLIISTQTNKYCILHSTEKSRLEKKIKKLAKGQSSQRGGLGIKLNLALDRDAILPLTC